MSWKKPSCRSFGPKPRKRIGSWSNRAPRDVTKPSIALKHEKIALIGFRGVGKSTLAALLSAELEIEAVSLDESIEAAEGRPIAEIVEEKGWNYFRELEAGALQEMAQRERLLLDTGGGVLEGAEKSFSKEKAEVLINNFFVIYIRLSAKPLMKRLEEAGLNSSRPPLGGETPEETFQRRAPWYEGAAHLIVDIDGLSPKKAVDKVLQEINESKEPHAGRAAH